MMIKPKSFLCTLILLAAPFLSHGSYQADSLYPVLSGCDTSVKEVMRAYPALLRGSAIGKQILAEIRENKEHEGELLSGIGLLPQSGKETNTGTLMCKQQLQLLKNGASRCAPDKYQAQLLHEAACLAMEWGKSAY